MDMQKKRVKLDFEEFQLKLAHYIEECASLHERLAYLEMSHRKRTVDILFDDLKAWIPAMGRLLSEVRAAGADGCVHRLADKMKERHRPLTNMVYQIEAHLRRIEENDPLRLVNPTNITQEMIDAEKVTCPVCRNDLQLGDVSAVSCSRCSQVYNKDCIGRWLTENDTCPSCRFKLKEITYDDEVRQEEWDEHEWQEEEWDEHEWHEEEWHEEQWHEQEWHEEAGDEETLAEQTGDEEALAEQTGDEETLAEPTRDEESLDEQNEGLGVLVTYISEGIERLRSLLEDVGFRERVSRILQGVNLDIEWFQSRLDYHVMSGNEETFAEQTGDEQSGDEPTTDQPTRDQPTTDQPTYVHWDEPNTDQPTYVHWDEPTRDEQTSTKSCSYFIFL